MNVNRLLRKLFTPAGKYINVGDMFISDGKIGIVLKKKLNKSNGYTFEMRWTGMTDLFIGGFTGTEVSKRLKSGEWKYYSSYSANYNEGNE
jgi:hypothetical protein